MNQYSICKISLSDNEIFESFVAKFNHNFFAVHDPSCDPSKETAGFSRMYRYKVSGLGIHKEEESKKIYELFSEIWHKHLSSMTGQVILVFTRTLTITGSLDLVCDLYVPAKAHQA